MVAETIAPGQSADVLISLPATTAASTLYPIYDASLALNNSTGSGIGGMLAMLDVDRHRRRATPSVRSTAASP